MLPCTHVATCLQGSIFFVCAYAKSNFSTSKIALPSA